MYSACERSAAAAVEAVAPEAEAVGPSWRFPLHGGLGAPVVTARVEDTWLLFDSPLGRGLDSLRDVGWLWSLLDAAAQPPGGVKVALVGEQSRLHARAELPLAVGGDLEARLDAVVRGFGTAASVVCGDLALPPAAAPGSGPASAARDGPSNAMSPGELSRLCADAGWEFTPRSSGRVMLDLEVGDRFHQATLDRRPGVGLALAADIAGCSPAADECGLAVAILLLRASGWLRMARAAVETGGDELLPRFEVAFELDPTPEELSEALSALSVAVRFGAAELRMLARSPELARSYLARQPSLMAGVGSGA